MPTVRGSTFRRVVLVLGSAEAAVLLFFVLVMLRGATTSDPLGRSIGTGMALLAAIPFVALVLPAIVLGCLNRWLAVALGLLVVAAPLSIMLWLFA